MTNRTEHVRLGHVHLKVRRLDRAIEFYQQTLGLQFVERVGDDFAFLSFGAAHHDLALQAFGDRAALPAPGAVGLYHVAFEVEDAATLLSRWDALQARGRVVGVDHGISWALYTNDPDRNGVEVYLDRRIEGSRTAWRGHSLPLERRRVEEVAASEPKTPTIEHIPSGGF
ncbi:MAG: VOC family protein [Phycisphaerales bacterium]|nr:VOC family protein [Phycisphaerales bacterium]